MNFTIVVCPKCKTKAIHTINTCGFECSTCHTFINEDDEQLKKEALKEQAETEHHFAQNYDDWKRRIKKWKAEQVYATFKKVNIPDERLIKLIEEEA